MRMPLVSSNAMASLLAIVLFIAPAIAQPVADPTDLDMDGEPGVAEAPAVANPQSPSTLVGSGEMLVDRTHRNTTFDVSGFTNYLAANGWTISALTTGPITEAALAGIDVLLIPAPQGLPGWPFPQTEITAIQNFLSMGGGLWVLHDNENPVGINTLSTEFGVTFQYDFVRDPSNNEGQLFWPTIYLLAAHPITTGVQSYGYYAGDCLAVTAPAQILGRADEDSYSLFCPAGSMPPTLAVWEEGTGRAVFSGDQTPFHPSYYPERLRAEEELLLQNIANWLLGDPPNATSPASWGSLKRAYTPGAE